MKKLNNLCISASLKLNGLKDRIKRKLNDDSGQFVLDNGLAIVIGCAAAGVIVALLLAYLKGDFSSSIKSSIANIFSQS